MTRWMVRLRPQARTLKEAFDQMAEETLVDLEDLDFEYGIGAEDHFVRCGRMLKSAKTYGEVVHAALELRQTIERLAFEYLVLVNNQSEGGLTKKELKLYKPRDLLGRLADQEPDLEKKIDFLNMTLQAQGISFKMLMPNGQFFHKTHGWLGNLLHLQRNELTEVQEVEHILRLQKTYSQLRSFVLDRGAISRYRPHSKLILSKYLRGEITKDEMQRMVTLSNIPEHMLDQKWDE